MQSVKITEKLLSFLYVSSNWAPDFDRSLHIIAKNNKQIIVSLAFNKPIIIDVDKHNTTIPLKV